MRLDREDATSYDAVVIGAGAAGLVAARELSAAGRSVLVLEARDRVGGRLWTDDFHGTSVEMGGTWVHWSQPHTWAELTRYGLDVVEGVECRAWHWLVGNERREGDIDQLVDIMAPAMDAFCADALDAFERPFDPLFSPALGDIDKLSVRDRLDQLDLHAEQRALLSGNWAASTSAPLDRAGLTSMLHWYALAGYTLEGYWNSASRYKIDGGTIALIDAIAADVRGEIRLGTHVRSIAQAPDHVEVRTDGERIIRAGAVIAAVPIPTLADLEISPSLSPAKLAAAAGARVSCGIKVWARVTGLPEPLGVLAPEEYPLCSLQTEKAFDDGSHLVVAFGADACIPELADEGRIRAAVQLLLPETAQVEAIQTHDWVGDDLAKGTWAIFGPGSYTHYIEELNRPEGRVVIAGADVALGWHGFIDGAIESGYRAARHVRQLLQVSTDADLG